MDQSRRRIAIAHFRGDLVLIGDQKGACQRRVFTKSSVDHTRGARPDPRQHISGRHPVVQVNGRARWRRSSYRDGGRGDKNKSARGGGAFPTKN